MVDAWSRCGSIPGWLGHFGPRPLPTRIWCRATGRRCSLTNRPLASMSFVLRSIVPYLQRSCQRVSKQVRMVSWKAPTPNGRRRCACFTPCSTAAPYEEVAGAARTRAHRCPAPHQDTGQTCRQHRRYPGLNRDGVAFVQPARLHRSAVLAAVANLTGPRRRQGSEGAQRGGGRQGCRAHPRPQSTGPGGHGAVLPAAGDGRPALRWPGWRSGI